MEKTISVKLSNSLVSLISQIAKETEQTESFHIQKALELYLEERADLQVSLDRLDDINDPIISLGDMRKELGL